jgi:hypothetical protein
MPRASAPLDVKSRIFLGAFIVLGILVVTGGADRLSDMAFHPWAHAEPPLLRHWVGRLTTGNGVPLVVALDLRRARGRRGVPCARCVQIDGTAATCDARGTLLRYRVSGSPEGRQAERVHLGTSPEREPPPEGLELNVLRGAWDGASGLNLEAHFIWRRAGAAVSSTDDPATQPVALRMEPTGETTIDRLCSLATPRAGTARRPVILGVLRRQHSQPAKVIVSDLAGNVVATAANFRAHSRLALTAVRTAAAAVDEVVFN